MRKKAAVNWTIGKLLNIVLLVILLVLIIYGVSTKGLNPLIDQIGNKANEVLILLNIKDDVSTKACFSEKVSVIGGGEELLKKLEIKDDAILNVCRNAICNITNAGLDMYRVKNGKFERLSIEDGWVSYNILFTGNTDSIKLNWEVYNKGVDILEEASVKSFYDDRFTKQFILYGDGSGLLGFGAFDKPSEAIWQNGYWKVRTEGKKFEVIKNYDKAINFFLDIANKIGRDKIYWKDGISVKPDGVYFSSVDIKDSIKDSESFGKVNTKESVEKLKALFIKKRNEFLKEVELSKEDIEGLRKSIEGKSFSIKDEVFVVSVEEGDKYPIVVFASDNNKFGFKYTANAKKYNSDRDFSLRYYPVSLVSWKGISWKEIGNEKYYRLPEKYFKGVYRETLVAKFLESKCRR